MAHLLEKIRPAVRGLQARLGWLFDEGRSANMREQADSVNLPFSVTIHSGENISPTPDRQQISAYLPLSRWMEQAQLEAPGQPEMKTARSAGSFNTDTTH